MNNFYQSLVQNPLCFLRPDRMVPPFAWSEHTPFAMYIIDLARPGILVELGTHRGVSYSAFCQAAHYLHLGHVRFYAVDSWQGDPHAGRYDEDIYKEFKAYHDKRYSAFSTLLRMTFDDALQYFSDGTIDLLHIDGYHTYEAVRHDFETWLPKMSDQGIILFHDINVRRTEFGVWRFWEELSPQYPHFEFIHGNGLGVLAVGRTFPGETALLFEAAAADANLLRNFFSAQGQRWRVEQEQENQIEKTQNQVAQRDQKLTVQQQAIEKRDEKITAQQQAIEKRDEKITAQQEIIEKRDEKITAQQQTIQQQQQQAEDLKKSIQKRDEKIAQLNKSKEQAAQLELKVREQRGDLRRLREQSAYHQLRTLRTSHDVDQSRLLRAVMRLRAGFRWVRLALRHRSGKLHKPALFDYGWYKDQYGHKIKLKRMPYVHYLVWGWQRGYSPSALFDPIWYLIQNQLEIHTEPLAHYLEQGWLEHYSPSPYFDVRYYLQNNPDVQRAKVEPLTHYLQDGWKEQRDPSPYFDVSWYLEKYPDVRQANVEPLTHYLRYGWLLGYSPSPKFDSAWYLERYGDVAKAGLEPLGHYLKYGLDEGRVPVKASSKSPSLQNSAARPALNPVKIKMPSSNRNRHSWDVYGVPIVDIVLDNHVLMKPPCVSVIIPIYNAYDFLVRCLSSIFQHTMGDVQLILINDASPDERIAPLINQYEGIENIIVAHNEVNMGFTRTVNRGLELAVDRDVILLNSDTEVGPRWVQNMIYAAYRSEQVGTVTAVSNNAGAFSVPSPGMANPIPPEVEIDSFIRLVSQGAYRLHPHLPTGNGFCMYIKRQLINEIGVLDAEAFPRGYGEENDFCMRALRQGWFNVIDDATYVIHERTASFGETKTELVQAGRKVVDQRYPEYTMLVRQHFNADKVKALQQHMANLVRQAKTAKVKPRVLFVISTKTGGTPQTNLDLMRGVQEHYQPFLLQCDKVKITLDVLVEDNLENVFEWNLSQPLKMDSHISYEYDQIVYSLLAQLGIELLHIRHIAWHSLNLTRIAHGLGIPIVFSFHDFYTIDPSVHLLNNDGQFSQTHFLQPSGEIRNPLWGNNAKIPAEWMHFWRHRMGPMLSYCSSFITTTQSTREILEKAFPFLEERPFYVIPHGRDFPQIRSVDVQNLPEPGQPLRILVAGNIGIHKGYDLLAEIKALDHRKHLELHFLGITRKQDIPGVYHGAYTRENFVELVANIRPHLSVILSIWPETFSHTLTESIAAGVPVLVTDLGAQAERVRQDGGGWITPTLDAAQIYKHILEIRDHLQDYQEKLQEVSTLQQEYLPYNTVARMASRYMHIYHLTMNHVQTFPDVRVKA